MDPPDVAYDKPRDENQCDEEETCAHHNCTLPKHPYNKSHSYEIQEYRPISAEASRQTSTSLMLVIEDVCDILLATRSEGVPCDIETPNSYSQAMDSRHDPRQTDRIYEERNRRSSLTMDIGVGRIDRKQKCSKLIQNKSKWVYKIMMNKYGSVERFKSSSIRIPILILSCATMRATQLQAADSSSCGGEAHIRTF